ncbi:hypothetical protein ACHAQF_007445 [Verticillium nonalfalfae]
MGGDLNLKKSFHPGLLKNQAKVWEEEKKALDERKKTQQRINELKEERAREEIQKQLEAAGHTKKIDRVDFLYNGPTNGQTGTTEEMEGYLLGKRRIDNLITGSDHKKLEKQAGQESFMALQTANTARDTAAKVREDPMLAIKKQEQAAYEAMMNDPIRRRQLLANMGLSEETKDRSPQDQHRRHFDGGRRNGGSAQGGGGGAKDNKADEEEKARKLAAMQSAASELDSSREQRLATLAQQEKAARDADDEARQRASKHGGENEFSNRLHRKAGDLGLAERMGRGRQGYQRDDD